MAPTWIAIGYFANYYGFTEQRSEVLSNEAVQSNYNVIMDDFSRYAYTCHLHDIIAPCDTDYCDLPKNSSGGIEWHCVLAG